MTATVTEKKAPAKVMPSGGFTVGYRDLVEALRTAAMGVSTRSGLPVMSRVLIEAGQGQVRVVAFDYETAVSVQLPAGEVSPGRMLVEHATVSRVLAAAVKGARKAQVDSATVRVEVVQGTLVVTVEGYAVPLAEHLDLEAFPDLPAITPASHVLDRVGFVDLLTRVAVAADRGGALPILAAVKVDLEEDRVTCTATDRYRLAQGWVAAEGTTTASALLPIEVLTKLIDRLGGDQVGIGLDQLGSDTWVTLTAGPVRASVRAREGDYPRVASVVNGQHPDVAVTVERAELLAVATRAAAITTAAAGKNDPVRVLVGAGWITIAPTTKASTRVTAPQVPAQVAGDVEQWSTGATPRYLLDAITATAGEQITVHLDTTDARRPLVFTAGGQDDLDQEGTYRHVLMPVTIPE